MQIALQLYTVRNVLDEDLAGGLKAVKDMGFDRVEAASTHGETDEGFAARLSEAGLQAVSTHGSPDEQGAAKARALGVKYLFNPWVGQDDRNAAGYTAIRESLMALQAAHPELGVGHHNHDFEFRRLEDGRRPINLINDANSLLVELDVAWVSIAGKSPADYLSRFAGRVPCVHVKDYLPADKVTFTEVGTGALDLPAVLEAAAKAKTEYLIVEQDHGWKQDDPLASAAESLERLQKAMA